jgi:S-adenosylmethionine:diacylglycerol 3-amino-3-carboxypropyl transferase
MASHAPFMYRAREVMRFFNALQYSSCSEDFSSEWRGLEVKPNDVIMAVCGGGGRAFAFLAEDVTSVYAVDANPHQISVAKFKVELMKMLSRQEFLIICGFRSSAIQRKLLLQTVEEELSQDSRDFFSAHRRSIVKFGLLFIGKVEIHFAFCAKVLNFIWRRELKELVSCADPSRREAIANELGRSKIWQRLLKIGTTPNVYRVFLQNIGWFTKRSHAVDVPSHLTERIDAAIRKYGMTQSHLLALVFSGTYDHLEEAHLPHYLRAGWYEKIQPRLGRIVFAQGDVTTYFPDELKSKAIKVSMSNVPSYLDEDARTRMWRMLSENLGVGSIICERRFLGNTTISPEVLAKFDERPERDLELAQADTSFAYDFRILAKN